LERLQAGSKAGSEYREGLLGVVAPGAYAEMILVEGNPPEDVSLPTDHDNTIKVVIKDGEVYANTLN